MQFKQIRLAAVKQWYEGLQRRRQDGAFPMITPGNDDVKHLPGIPMKSHGGLFVSTDAQVRFFQITDEFAGYINRGREKNSRKV